MSRVLQNAVNQITCPYGNGHIGIDLVKQWSQVCPITAHTKGRVIELRTDCKGWEPGGSYGNYILLEHQNGIKTRYAHLSQVYVSYGQTVDRGEVIGYMGATGFTDGAHLHFEVYVDNVVVDPTPFINAALPRQTELNGLVKIADYVWYYYKDGAIDRTCNSIVKNSYGWWKVTNGQVDFNYNGLAKNDYGWWMLQGGKVDFDFNGIACNQYGFWVVKNGKVDFSFSGEYKFSGCTYKVKEGKVI